MAVGSVDQEGVSCEPLAETISSLSPSSRNTAGVGPPDATPSIPRCIADTTGAAAAPKLVHNQQDALAGELSCGRTARQLQGPRSAQSVGSAGPVSVAVRRKPRVSRTHIGRKRSR